MRQVKPTTFPLRLRRALIRWSVRSIPARLSSPNSPMRSTTYSRSPLVIGCVLRITSPSGNRPSANRPRSITISSSSLRFSSRLTASWMPGGSVASRASRSSVIACCIGSFILPLFRPVACPPGRTAATLVASFAQPVGNVASLLARIDRPQALHAVDHSLLQCGDSALTHNQQGYVAHKQGLDRGLLKSTVAQSSDYKSFVLPHLAIDGAYTLFLEPFDAKAQ